MRKARTIGSIWALVAVVGATLATGSAAAAKAGCGRDAPGGEWSSYGQDLTNSRTQSAEDVIGVAEAPHLEPQWTFSSVSGGGDGGFQSTPVVAGGCVFAGTTSGWVFAVNADTGELVWKQNFTAGGLVGGIFALSVVDGRVHANVSGAEGPYAAAADQETGKILWKTPILDKYPGAYSNASSVVYDGLVFMGISGPEGDRDARGSYVILDAATGKLIRKEYVIPKTDNKRGFGGAGIWSTAVVDTQTDYLYVGAGNPYGNRRDHRYANAILKVDLRQDRKTFGQIVDAYKGDVEQYYPPLEILADTPVCAAELDPTIDNPECGQLDLDYGASPNLFTNEDGEKLVGVLQKSGVYHVAYADTMERAWTTVVGGPCALCNAASSAFDGSAVYVAGAPGSILHALDKTTGSYRWSAPIADGVHYQAVSVANGVVYATDTTGSLDMFDAATGVPVFTRPLSADTAASGDACGTLGGNTSIARHKVYVACDVAASSGGWIVAYGYDAE